MNLPDTTEAFPRILQVFGDAGCDTDYIKSLLVGVPMIPWSWSWSCAHPKVQSSVWPRVLASHAVETIPVDFIRPPPGFLGPALPPPIVPWQEHDHVVTRARGPQEPATKQARCERPA